MDDQRRDQSGIVVGCLVVGFLIALLGAGWVAMRAFAVPAIRREEQQAIRAEQAAREAKMSTTDEGEKPIPQRETAQPEVK